MAKSVANAVLDAALNYLADQGDRIDICSAEPTTYAEATSTYTLGTTTMTLGAGNGDYSAIADGDTSGRKITVLAQTGISVTSTGTATHIAITDGTAALLYVTTCTSQAVTSGNTADLSAWDVEIADPT